MSSYEINLIEGERGKMHVTSDDARTENALMFGVGRKVFNMDDCFEATLINNNTVRIASGVFYDNGMFIRIDRDKYVQVNIENGLPGTFRNDLICIRYERNIQTQLESASIVVKKGVASETVADDPEYTEGDVLDLEVHLDEFPLYRVALDGLMPTLEPMFFVEDMISTVAINEKLMETNEEVEELKRKHDSDTWIIISDSYGTVYPEASTTKTFFEYMRDLSGRNSENLIGLAYSGCGFINNAGGKTFLQGFTEFTNTYDFKEEVSKIIISAGRNDYISTTSEIYNAELEFFHYCKDNYPNAEIIFAFIANGDHGSAGTRQQLIQVYDAYRKCTEFGAKYMNGSEAILHNSDCMASDGIHPSIYGKQQIAKYVLEGITTGVCHVCYPVVQVKITCANDNMTLVNHSCKQWVEDNICYIEFDSVNQITFTNAYGMSPQNIYQQIVGVYKGTRYLTHPLREVCIKENCQGYNQNNELNEKLSVSYFFNSDGILWIKLYATNGTQSTKYIISFGNNIIAIPCVYC